MSELIAGIVGAIIGALAGAGLAWSQKAADERRKRRATATALLFELYALANTLKYLHDHWRHDLAAVAFPKVVHEQFGAAVEYFEPPAVHAVLDFFGTVRDVENGLATLSGADPRDPERVRAEIRMLAGVGMTKSYVAYRALKREGGTEPDQKTLKPGTEEEVVKFIRRIGSPWDDPARSTLFVPANESLQLTKARGIPHRRMAPALRLRS